MRKYTQKHLKELVKCGFAKDVTHANVKDGKVINGIPERYSQIGYSAGIYGCNGRLFEGESGQWYTVTARTNAIYVL